MAEPEREALIRVQIEHLIPVAGLNARMSLDDTAVATEITAFTREDDAYNLEGALILTGVLREAGEVSEDELFADLQGDVLTSMPEEKGEGEPIPSFHYRLPFHLYVPVGEQEGGLLNVFARIGQWDLRYDQPDRARLLGELIIYGLNGKGGYVFRCGEEEVKAQAETSSFTREGQAGREPETSKLAATPAEGSLPWMGKEASPAGKTAPNGRREEKSKDHPTLRQPAVQEPEGYDEEEWIMDGDDGRAEEVHFIPDQEWVSRLNAKVADPTSAEENDPWAEKPPSSEPEKLAVEELAEISLQEQDLVREQETPEPSAEFIPPEKGWAKADAALANEGTESTETGERRTSAASGEGEAEKGGETNAEESSSLVVESSAAEVTEKETPAGAAQPVQEVGGDDAWPVLAQEESSAELEAEHEPEHEPEQEEEKEATISIGGKKQEVWLGWKFKEDNKYTFKFRIVQESDQLERLAETYSCSVSEIMRANGMTHEQLDTGQVLYIPTRRR